MTEFRRLLLLLLRGPWIRNECVCACVRACVELEWRLETRGESETRIGRALVDNAKKVENAGLCAT